MLYRILKLIVGIGIRLYYRETKVRNAHFLKHDGPMIIIANHPNTLMDAWMVGNVCQQPIYYMAKGTFFSSPIKRRILQSLNMIPINRKVDGKIKGIGNIG
jgi:1-acyl-sn-glycerol-3-phosphate acyltransferase